MLEKDPYHIIVKRHPRHRQIAVLLVRVRGVHVDEVQVDQLALLQDRHHIHRYVHHNLLLKKKNN